MELDLANVVAECFDGASNMSGIHRGLATRMKQSSPLGIFIHCYGHRLNLALQSTLADVEALQNALGTIQTLNNFIEGSTKRQALLKNIQIEDYCDMISLTLKLMSSSRWWCCWMAVKTIYEQIYNLIKALLVLTTDKDQNTYRDSKALLNAVGDFHFVFGLLDLKIILSNTDALSKYLQGKDVDGATAKKTFLFSVRDFA